ncbi:lipoyl(octanoyl) transferase LipB [Aliagarivorans marinus]|uniref:lipoyl(octanoyl) transferase LipB n=1 Tax=Aliagarivorans marinus TaxID=561965 RepID=UPI0004236235|nr:lipoyl(octanoyl) transferase LipB [Aliagarivorans marinus]
MAPLIVRHLGLQAYLPTQAAMKDYTEQRDDHSPDELWVVEHPPVFTQGQAGKPEHLLQSSDIPVVQTERGGQVTYHGPGQLVVYTLIDLKRANIGVRELVSHIENCLIAVLGDYGIKTAAKKDAPGVYVDGQKIASLGLKIRKGRSFHGLALNVAMDLNPFLLINPCGYAGLVMTQTSVLGGPTSVEEAAQRVAAQFAKQLNYSDVTEQRGFQ